MTAALAVALLAVSDQSGVADFGRGLAGLGWDLVATTGIAALLREVELDAVDVGAATGVPTLLGGRPKSLHHQIFGGLLRRRGLASDDEDVRRFELLDVDLLACNFYPFERTEAPTVRRVELIDVGGQAMLRAAALAHVIPIVDPDDYPAALSALAAAGEQPRGVSPALRQTLVARAFALTADCDSAIARWLSSPVGPR